MPPGDVHGEREALDPIGIRDRELLRDHAAEAGAERAARVPADGVEQRRRVGRVVGHLVRALGDLGLPEATLVVGDDVELLGEAVDHHARLRQRLAAALEVEEPGTAPLLLVVDVDAVAVDRGHGRSIAGLGAVVARARKGARPVDTAFAASTSFRKPGRMESGGQPCLEPRRDS